MNFLAHYVLATRFLTPAAPLSYYVVGNALPDLLPLAVPHSRFRPSLVSDAPAQTPEENALRAGVLAHLATDTAFHKTAAFAQAQTEISHLLQSTPFDAMRIRRFFLAHIIVELTLDAALLRQEQGVADEFYNAFNAAHFEQVTAWTERALGKPLPELPLVLTRFTLSEYLRRYDTDAGVAYGINKLCARARQDTFWGDNETRLTALVSDAIYQIAPRIPPLLSETKAGIDAGIGVH